MANLACWLSTAGYAVRMHSSKGQFCAVACCGECADVLSLLTTRWQESLDSRGQQREEELAAYEARLFCEMLLKGAVNIFEVPLPCHNTHTQYFVSHSRELERENAVCAACSHLFPARDRLFSRS